MEPSIYKNFKFGNTQVKYLYQGPTLVWPPSPGEDEGDPTTGYDSSMIDFTEIDWWGGHDEYRITGELSFKNGGIGDASLWYEFNGYPVIPSNVKLGFGTFEDGTTEFVILMNKPGALDGAVYMYGTVTENSDDSSLSPGLMIKTIQNESFTKDGITPHSTPYIGTGTATEEISLPGLFRQVSFKIDNEFFVKSGNSSVTIPEQTIYPPKNSSNVRVSTYVIPPNATSISESMFYNNRSIKQLEIRGPRLSTVPSQCCAYCTSLTTVKIPESVTLLDYRAFYNCTSLHSITADGLTPPTCGISCFDNVGNNGFIMIVADASTDAWIDWYTGNGLKAKGWTIIQDENPIDSSIYSSTQVVTYVTSDGKEVFPNEVDYSYRNIVFHSYNKVKNVGTLIYASPLTALPQGRGEFASTKLVSINFPHTVTSIGNSMFYNCQEMTTFVMPAQVTSLGNSVFQNCSKLRLVDLSRSGVTDIYGTTFTNCSSLKYVTFPSSLNVIHGSPFTGGHNLEYIRFLGASAPDLTDYNYEPDRPEYSAFYDTWWWKDGEQFFPPIYVPNPIVYKNSSTEWEYWYDQGRVKQG